MNSLFGSGFGAIYPAMLLIAPVIFGVLVYAYLRKGRGEQVLVSSVLLLRKLKNFSVARRKFVPPFRFFFELLLLTLLLAAVAGVYFGNHYRKYAVVIDNSLSMLAGQVSDPASSSFERAIRLATDFIQSVSSDSEIQIYTVAPEFQPISESSLTPIAAVDLLQQVKAAFADDNLSPALSRLLAMQKYDRVVVFSDHSLAPDAQRDQTLLFRNVREDGASAGAGNLVISHIALKLPTLGEESAQVSVLVKSFANLDLSAKVELRALDQDGTAFKLLASQQVNLSANDSKQISFAGVPVNARAFHASIEGLGRDAARLNLLRWDDNAFLTGESKSGHLLIVSDLSTKALGLDTLNSLQFDHLEPGQYEQTAGSDPKYLQLPTLFHRYVPPEWPKTSAALINPNANKLFEVRAGAAASAITDWQVGNPLLDYLNLAEIKLQSTTILENPVWGRSLITSTEGSIAFIGENEGAKILALGFEIFPFEGRNSPTLSIFTLNIFKYLTGVNASQGYVPTFSALKDAEVNLRGRYLTPTIYPYILGADENRRLPYPGLFELQHSSSAKEIRAVNFFSDSESEFLNTEPLVLPKTNSVAKEELSTQPLTTNLAWIVFFLVLLDLSLPLLKWLWRKRSTT